MASLEVARAVAVVGMRRQEFVRFRQMVSSHDWPVRLVYGGHISDGSNARRKAERAAAAADFVLWNPNGARKFGGGYISQFRYQRIRGVASAMELLADWLTAGAFGS